MNGANPTVHATVNWLVSKGYVCFAFHEFIGFDRHGVHALTIGIKRDMQGKILWDTPITDTELSRVVEVTGDPLGALSLCRST